MTDNDAPRDQGEASQRDLRSGQVQGIGKALVDALPAPGSDEILAHLAALGVATRRSCSLHSSERRCRQGSAQTG